MYVCMYVCTYMHALRVLAGIANQVFILPLVRAPI